MPEHAREWALVVRPERLLVLDKTSSPSQPMINGSAFDGIVFAGTIRESVFQGESAFLIVALEQGSDVRGSSASVSDTSGVEVAVRFSTGTAANIENLSNGQKIELGLYRQDVIVIPQEPS